jgi:hypothetical protein
MNVILLVIGESYHVRCCSLLPLVMLAGITLLFLICELLRFQIVICIYQSALDVKQFMGRVINVSTAIQQTGTLNVMHRHSSKTHT